MSYGITLQALTLQTVFDNFGSNVFKRQLRQSSACEYLIIRHFRKSKRRYRVFVQLVVCLKTCFRQNQPEKIAKEHIDRKLLTLEFEPVTILANLVCLEDRQDLHLLSVEISICDQRSGIVFWVGRKLLRKLHHPF